MERGRPGWEEGVAVLSMVLLVLITLSNVLTRYLSDESIAWTEEISVFLMVVLALAGGSAAARADRHIRIEVLLQRRGPAGEAVPRWRLRAFGLLLTSIMFAGLGGLFVRWVADQVRYGETSMGLGVPLWWYGIVVPPLCLALSARSFAAFLAVMKARGERAAQDAP